MSLKNEILDLSRQNQQGPLSPWLDREFDRQIATGDFLGVQGLNLIAESLVKKTKTYSEETNVSTAVLGMSGGVDSALTAAIFKAAGWNVIGVTMPIHQLEAETQRGIDACKAIGIEHLNLDLSALADLTVQTVGQNHSGITNSPGTAKDRIRRGNIRARLRMIALYDLANAHGGIVASTDNLSELGAGFWTINGDVGDFSPIQSLLKSWEVPYLARHFGIPEDSWRATPTDGLAILNGGDEAQLGCSYLEWDIMMMCLGRAVLNGACSEAYILAAEGIDKDERALQVFHSVMLRMRQTWFKRFGAIKLPHPIQNRYAMIDALDHMFNIPPSVISQI